MIRGIVWPLQSVSSSSRPISGFFDLPQILGRKKKLDLLRKQLGEYKRLLGVGRRLPIEKMNRLGSLVVVAMLVASSSAQFVLLRQANVNVEPVCEEQVELIESQSCKPYYEFKCMTEDITVEEIKYEKRCKDIVDVVCGNNDVDQEEKYEDDSEEENEETTLLKLLIGFRSNVGPSPRRCHEVPREHCYTMPVVREVKRPADKCYVVTRVKCDPKTDAVKKVVCSEPKPPTVNLKTAERVKGSLLPYLYQYPSRFLYKSVV